jgi:transposase
MARKLKLLSEAHWEKIAPLFPEPEQSKKGGRKFIPNRSCFEGILWILWTGAPWKALPGEYPSPSTCWRRLKRWEEDGTWLRAWRCFIAQLDEKQQLDWSESFVDATFAPAKKGALQSERRSVAKAQSSWWWQTARVFLWESSFVRHPHMSPRSQKKR